MVQICTKAMFSVLLIALVSLGFSRADEPTKGSPESSAAIKMAVADWISAFNRHDAHATTMAYSEDADLTNMIEVNYHGRQEIEQLFQTIFATRLKNAHRTAEVKGFDS